MSASLGYWPPNAHPPEPACSLTSSILRTRKRGEDTRYWMMANHWACPKKQYKKCKQKRFRKKKQKKKEKPNSIHYKESQGDSRLMSKRENDIILTKHKFHTTLDWLAVRSHTGGTVSHANLDGHPVLRHANTTHHTHHYYQIKS